MSEPEADYDDCDWGARMQRPISKQMLLLMRIRRRKIAKKAIASRPRTTKKIVDDASDSEPLDEDDSEVQWRPGRCLRKRSADDDDGLHDHRHHHHRHRDDESRARDDSSGYA